MKKFDVVIIGGRVAGSSLSLLLSQAGFKVAVFEKQTQMDDVISTHFMNPRGMTYLKKLGVLDEVLKTTPAFRYFELAQDDFELGGEVTEDVLKQRMERVHPETEFELETRYACIRRTLLDPTLQHESKNAGTTFFYGYRFKTIENNVCTFETKEGDITISADLIVGADGRYSTVADKLQIPKLETRTACTFACYSYYSGLSLPHALLKKRNRISYAAVPTSEGKTMVLVYGPSPFHESFRENLESNFFKAIESVDPKFAATFKKSAKREEPFRMTIDQSGFYRKSADKKVGLIGDAACSKDQCTASGMTHALRDAFLLSEELGKAKREGRELVSALVPFESRRYLDLFRYYEFTCSQAEMNPLRPEEKELFEAISMSQEEKNLFVGLYCDTVDVRAFFSSRRVERLIKQLKPLPKTDGTTDLEEMYGNPFEGVGQLKLELEQSCQDYSQSFGKNFFERAEPYYQFYLNRELKGAFQYARTLHRFPGTTTRLSDASGRTIEGVNFASQDYLGFGQHPKIQEAAKRAIDTYGPHSAGSPMIIGDTLLTRELEAELKKLTGKKHVLIFPTGYAAGMGSILGIVRPHDSIVMDRLSHASLQQGARAATKNVYRYAHLDVDAARAVLSDLRKRDKRNGILLITEGLFSMDADSPDLKAFQEVASEFNATLFVDVAHDLGAMGPFGTGQAGLQGMHGKLDLVMGSFSKTFATNGGFLATDSEAIIHYLKMFSTAHLFSNALSPVQAAVALESARIIQSEEGALRRENLMRVVKTLRRSLEEEGLVCLGNPSPIVPVMIGTEAEARLCHRGLMERNIAAMIIEYPVVALGQTRFRLQVMASHTEEQARETAKVMGEVVRDVKNQTKHFNKKLPAEFHPLTMRG